MGFQRLGWCACAHGWESLRKRPHVCPAQFPGTVSASHVVFAGRGFKQGCKDDEQGLFDAQSPTHGPSALVGWHWRHLRSTVCPHSAAEQDRAHMCMIFLSKHHTGWSDCAQVREGRCPAHYCRAICTSRSGPVFSSSQTVDGGGSL